MLNKNIKINIRPTSFKSISTTLQDKPTADIVAIYQKLINKPIKKVGNRVTVPCCFHDDHSPSLVLYPNTSSYYCYSCSHGGDVYKFVEEVLGCSFKEALEFIKENQ